MTDKWGQRFLSVPAIGASLFVLAVLALSIFMNLSSSSTTHAAQTIPYKVNFQGRLTDASGNIKPDGLYNMKIRIYSAVSGGTLLGTEIRDGSYRAQVTNGLFSIQIGDNTALAPSLFTNYPLYIEIELPTPATATCTTAGCGTWTEGPMSPRSPLGSSPYAFNSDTIDGIDGSSLARNDANNTFSVASSNTYNGTSIYNNTQTLANNALLGLNINGTAGAYTLQNAGTGTYFYSDGSAAHIGITVAGSSGGSVTPTDGVNDAIVVANAQSGYVAAINAGVRSGNNLIDNGGFEFGCGGWTGCVIDTTNTHTGNKAAKFVMSSATSVQTVAPQLVAAQPDDVIYVQGWIKTTAATTGTGFVSICYYDKDGVWLNVCDTGATANPGTTYALRTLTGSPAPANTAYAKAKFQNGGNGSTAGTWYYDDLSVAQVNRPEGMTTSSDLVVTDGARVTAKDALGETTFQTGGDANGSIELGKSTGASTTPFMDFHYGTGSTQDYNIRMINSADGVFDIQNAGSAYLLSMSATALRVGRGDVSPNATPTLLVVDHKSTSGDPTGTNGGMYYNANTGKFRCYEDSLWKDCISSGPGRDLFQYSTDFISTNYLATNEPDITWDGATASLTQGTTLAGRPGVGNININGSSTARMSLSGNTSVFDNLFLGNGSTWTASAGFMMPTLSDGSVRYTLRFGFIDSVTAESTDGCFLRYVDNVNSGAWQGVCRNNASESVCNTTATAAASTWYDVKVGVNSAGTLATFVVNDTLSCTVSTNIPTGAGRATSYGVYAQKNLSTTARTISIDYMDIRGDLVR